jgi:hypothetical protein
MNTIVLKILRKYNKETGRKKINCCTRIQSFFSIYFHNGISIISFSNYILLIIMLLCCLLPQMCLQCFKTSSEMKTIKIHIHIFIQGHDLNCNYIFLIIMILCCLPPQSCLQRFKTSSKMKTI